MIESIDVTGLSADSVRMIESLVRSLRSEDNKKSWNQRDPDGWAAALHLWVESHPKREIVIDDSRETIYAGRGE